MRAMRNFFNPVVGDTPEVTEAWDSEPNPGLAESKTVTIFSGTTLGGSSAVNGGQFSTPTNEVRCRRASFSEPVVLRFETNDSDRSTLLHIHVVCEKYICAKVGQIPISCLGETGSCLWACMHCVPTWLNVKKRVWRRSKQTRLALVCSCKFLYNRRFVVFCIV